MKKIAVIFPLLLHLGSFSQNNYGYIEYDSVVNHIPEVIAFQEKLDLKMKGVNDSITLLQYTFEASIMTMCSHIDYSIEQRKLYEEKAIQLETNITAFCDSARYRINRLQANNNDLLRKLVVSKIQSFAELNEIEYPYNKSSVLYCEDCCDYTFQFIEFLKEQ